MKLTKFVKAVRTDPILAASVKPKNFQFPCFALKKGTCAARFPEFEKVWRQLPVISE